MSEKLHTQPTTGWEQTESGLLIPAEGTETYVSDSDVIVTDSRSITPESVEQSFVESQEKAREPLSREELVNATGALETTVSEALDRFNSERKAGNEVGTDQDGSNLRVTAQALHRLKDMYNGTRDIDQKIGESTEEYLDRMVATYTKEEHVYHPAESAVDAKGYTGSKIYEYTRMRKVHNALKASPDKARVSVLGEISVVKGSDDATFEQVILGTMHYGEDVELSVTEIAAAA